jgi:hypothetical protein
MAAVLSEVVISGTKAMFQGGNVVRDVGVLWKMCTKDPVIMRPL